MNTRRQMIDRANEKENNPFECNLSVIISGVNYKEGENVMELVRAVHSEDLQWESLPGVVAKLWQERRGALYRTKWIYCRGNKDSTATKKYEDFKSISTEVTPKD